MKKKIVAALAALLIAVSLSACGGSEEHVVLDFSEPTAFSKEIDVGSLSMRFGELLSVHQNGDKVIIKAKIKPNATTEMTVNQNFFAVADLIKNHGFNTCGELEYWAVADMTSGKEEKVVRFTLEKETIDGIYSGAILENAVRDHATDVWLHQSLRK